MKLSICLRRETIQTLISLPNLLLHKKFPVQVPHEDIKVDKKIKKRKKNGDIKTQNHAVNDFWAGKAVEKNKIHDCHDVKNYQQGLVNF